MSGRSRIVVVLLSFTFIVWMIWRSGTKAPPSVVDIEGEAFSGTVTDPQRRPIEGALVEVLWVGAEEELRVLGSARADRAGIFRVPSQHPRGEQGTLMLRASAAGFATAGRELNADAKRQDFVLRRAGARVTLHVEDERGSAVAGAEVTLGVEPAAGASGALTLFSARTGESGDVVFDAIAAEDATLHYSAIARGRGAASGQRRQTARETDVRIDARLDGGGRVAGAVLDETGRPVANVTVHAAQVEGPWMDDAQAQSDGKFAITAAPRARISLEVRGDWVLSGGREKIFLDLTAPAEDTRLVVEPAGVIAGRVTRADGAPIGGVAVRAAPVARTSASPRVVTTGADGRFTMRGLRAGTTWDLDASHEDSAPAFAEKIVVGDRNVQLQLRAGGALAGRVVDERGAGVAEVEVYAHLVRKSERAVLGLREYHSVRTRADGAYRLDHLNEGIYRVEVRPLGRMAWSSEKGLVHEATVREGQTSSVEDSQVARPGEIRGRVKVASGRAPAALSVSLLPDGEGGSPHRMQVRCAADGSFVLVGIEPGVYAMTIHDVERGFARAGAVRVSAGEAASAAFFFEERREVEGTVLDADRKPVEGAMVDAYAQDAGSQAERPLPGRAPDNFTGNFARTDERGHFVIRGVAAGRYRVRVAKDGLPAAAVDVEVPTNAIVLTLPRAASLEVALARVEAPANRVVLVEALGGPGHSGAAVTDARGVARFEGVSPGSYRVRAIVEGAKEASVVLAAGEAKKAVIEGEHGGDAR